MAVSVAEQAAFDCCASRAFASALAARSPYASLEALLAEARHIWWNEVRCMGMGRERARLAWQGSCVDGVGGA